MLDALLTATDPRARESTWGVFVDRYTPLLLRTVYRFVRSYDDVMDRYTYLLEELRRNEFRRLRAFAAVGPGRFTTWLVVVTSRLLLDFHRQRYGRARLPTTKRRDAAKTAATMRKRLAEMVGEELRAGTVEDWSTDPEDGTCAVECAEAIQAAVSSLAPRDQLLLKLRFHEDLAARQARGSRQNAPRGPCNGGQVYRRLTRRPAGVLDGVRFPSTGGAASSRPAGPRSDRFPSAAGTRGIRGERASEPEPVHQLVPGNGYCHR